MASVQEMTVDIAAGTAEQETGGVRMNLIPREGGNALSGSFFGTAANSSFQGSNYDDDLKARGLRTPDEIKLNYDFNPAVGGPLVQDKVWFFSAARFVKNENYVGGVLANLNAGDPTKWLYAADEDTRGIYNLTQQAVNTPRHLAGEPEEQAQLLLRSPVALLVPAHQRQRLARVGQHLPLPGPEHGHA